MERGDGASGEALEAIAYLARSRNRVDVLEALTRSVTKPGRPIPSLPRREIREVTGTSRSTLGRILTEFEERGWAFRNGEGEYEATPQGEHIAAEFKPLLRSMETIHELGEAVGILPVSELSMGPEDDLSISHRHFRDATVRETANWDPHELERFYADLLEDASTFRALIYVGPFRAVDRAVTERTRSGEMNAKGVFSATIVDRLLRTPEFGPTKEDVAVDNLELHRSEEHIPCNLWIVDETVALENSQVEGVEPGTLILSEDPTVRRWARKLFDRYLEGAREISAEDFQP